MLFYLLGCLISALIGNFVPGSVIGMVLLFAALSLKWVRPGAVKRVATFLLDNMMLFFVPVGVGLITSRIGVQREALVVTDDTNILELYLRENEKCKIDCVLIDECQFLKKHHVQELVEIVDSCGVPVLAYGLKNDFRNELFEGSYYMLIYADKIEEIKTICWCGRKATMVARVVDGQIVKQGEQVVIGGNDMYVSLCRKHYNDGRISEKK